MDASEITTLLSALNGRGSDEEFLAAKRLHTLKERCADVLLEHYKRAPKYGQRASCVYHATRYAKTSDAAYQLGILALQDKSKHVRYRACLLLSIAQRKDALVHLREALTTGNSVADVKAAIDAVESENHNYFADRTHSGKVFINASPFS